MSIDSTSLTSHRTTSTNPTRKKPKKKKKSGTKALKAATGALKRSKSQAPTQSLTKRKVTKKKRAKQKEAKTDLHIKHSETKEKYGQDPFWQDPMNVSMRSLSLSQQALVRLAIEEAKQSLPWEDSKESVKAECSEVSHYSPSAQKTKCLPVELPELIDLNWFNASSSISESEGEDLEHNPSSELRPLPLQALHMNSLEIDAIAVSDQVRKLNLSQSDIDTERLNVLIQKFPRLETLILSFCTKLQGEEIDCLAQLKDLKVLRLNACDFLSETAIEGLFEKSAWSQIEELDLALTKLSSKALSILCQKCPTLKHLSIELCENVEEDVLTKIENLTNLETLNLKGLVISKEVLDKLQSAMPYVRIEYAEGDFTQKNLAALPAMSFQEKLDLASTDEQIKTQGNGAKNPSLELCPLFLYRFYMDQDVLPHEINMIQDQERISQFYVGMLEKRGEKRGHEMHPDYWNESEKLLQHLSAAENAEKILSIGFETVFRGPIQKSRGIDWDAAIGKLKAKSQQKEMKLPEFSQEHPSDLQSFAVFLKETPDMFSPIEALNLFGLKLDFFPQILASTSFHHLQFLDLSDNQLEFLPPNFFSKAPKLRKMDLSRNQIRFLSEELLLFFPEMQEIDLSHNRLSFIPPQLFQPCAKLTKIDLSHNALTKDSFVEEDLGYLHRSKIEVDLTDNSALSELEIPIGSKVFVGNAEQSLGRLLKISPPKGIDWEAAFSKLNEKRIRSEGAVIQKSVPTNMEELSQLLQEAPEIFSVVKTLDFSSIGITALPTLFTSASFHHLESLNISNNQLRLLPPRFFLHAPNLRSLNLSENQLKFLHEDHLFSPNIEELDLSQNELEFIPNGFFQNFLNLKTLNLSGNDKLVLSEADLEDLEKRKVKVIRKRWSLF